MTTDPKKSASNWKLIWQNAYFINFVWGDNFVGSVYKMELHDCIIELEKLEKKSYKIIHEKCLAHYSRTYKLVSFNIGVILGLSNN